MEQYDIWTADIPTLQNSHVQYGRRPVVIVSNNSANDHSPVITVIPLTSRLHKCHLPTHVYLEGQGLEHGSIALCEQVMALGKIHLLRRIGVVYKPFDRVALRHALAIHLGIEFHLKTVA